MGAEATQYEGDVPLSELLNGERPGRVVRDIQVVKQVRDVQGGHGYVDGRIEASVLNSSLEDGPKQARQAALQLHHRLEPLGTEVPVFAFYGEQRFRLARFDEIGPAGDDRLQPGRCVEIQKSLIARSMGIG